MRIGIITFHFVHNQGGVLQCYGLKTALEHMGHDAFVIDYKPAYHFARYAAIKNPFVIGKSSWNKNRDKGKVKQLYIASRGFARALVDNVKGTDKVIEGIFNEFVGKHLTLTKRYKTLRQLKVDYPQMDVYITGSDQLWNPDLLDQEFDAAYFLDFGPESIKRISYAVSLRQVNDDKELEQLKVLCQRLNSISIREQNAAFLQAIRREVTICIDPSLLLDETDYSLIEEQVNISEPYIFVYGFETTKEINDAVNMVASSLKCIVINGKPDRIRLDIEAKAVRDYGPGQFLSYIKNAEYVVTSSFHGTAFSIIYKKRFITIPHTTRGNRMKELLIKLGLNNCLWEGNIVSIEDYINYEGVYEKLNVLRKQAFQYLNSGID